MSERVWNGRHQTALKVWISRFHLGRVRTVGTVVYLLVSLNRQIWKACFPYHVLVIIKRLPLLGLLPSTFCRVLFRKNYGTGNNQDCWASQLWVALLSLEASRHQQWPHWQGLAWTRELAVQLSQLKTEEPNWCRTISIRLAPGQSIQSIYGRKNLQSQFVFLLAREHAILEYFLPPLARATISEQTKAMQCKLKMDTDYFL